MQAPYYKCRLFIVHVGSLLSVGNIVAGAGITGASLNITGQSTLADTIVAGLTATGDIFAAAVTSDTLATGNISAASVLLTGDLNVQGDLSIGSLLDQAGEQFIIPGRGIDINADPVTGQLEVSSPLGGKIKFVNQMQMSIERSQYGEQFGFSEPARTE